MAERNSRKGRLNGIDGRRVARYKRVMPRDPNELAKYKAALAALRCASAAGDRDDEADIDKAAAALDRMCVRREAGRSPVSSTAAPRPDGMAPSVSSDKYRGKSFAEAAVAFLEQLGQEMRVADIAASLISEGYEVSSERPATALAAALERRSANFNDVVKVRHGVWCHERHLSAKQRAALEHKKRTSLGMARRKARGLNLGQPAKITPEVEAEIERMLLSGKSVKEAAKRFGVAGNTVYTRFKGERLAELRARAKANPPPDDQDQSARLRVVGGGATKT